MRTLLQMFFLSLLVQSRASLAEGWGAPSHSTALQSLLDEDRQLVAGAEQFTVSAGGAAQQTSTMMRRHKEGHKLGHPEAMFKALDLNGDGLISGAELKAKANNVDFRIPKTLMELLSHVDDNDDSGITYEYFLKGVHQVDKDHALHRTRASIHKHVAAAPKEGMLLEVSGDGETAETPQAAWVTCGGHKAPTCAECPTTNSIGEAAPDHGVEWCHGDCIYHGSSCHLKGTVTVSDNAHNKTMNHIVNHTVSETMNHQQQRAEPIEAPLEPVQRAEGVPDILNPEITAKDKKVIRKAAQSGAREAQREEEEEAKQKEEKEDKEDKSKVWLILVITFSILLVFCAIASIIALGFFYFNHQVGPVLTKDSDNQGQSLVDGEGEGGASSAHEESIVES